MSSSDSDSDSIFNLDTSSEDDSFAIMKSLLADPIYKVYPFESSSRLTRNMLNTTLALIPLVLHSLSKKRRYSGSTHGRRNVREKKNEQNSNDYLMDEGSKYSPEGDDNIIEDASIAHGVPAGDEYAKIRKNAALESLIRFCDAVIGVFEGRYLRKPNDDDIETLLKQNEDRRFPGMIGSIDCMHWRWSNCPKGFEKVPTVIFEIVASEDLWIWHALLRVVSIDNDITVLDRSPWFDDTMSNVAPPCNFEVQGHRYDTGYYLSDGKYPLHPALIQTVSQPSNPKQRYFSKKHECVRKDVERAFAVLLKRWHIIKALANMWNAKDFGKIVKTCIIFHNMIIESERRQGFDPESWEPPANENIQNVELEQDRDFLLKVMLDRFNQVQDTGVHNDLKRDIMDNMWTLHGNDPVECRCLFQGKTCIS